MQDKNWFINWFNSPYYHVLYKDRNEQEAEHFIDNLVSFLKPAPSSKTLDLACGKGRHAIYLNKKGLDVTGVDLSEESIRHARQFENETLSFYVHDMRRTLIINGYDFVFNLFTSFGYFEKDSDNKATLKAATGALKMSGTLVLDFMNVNKSMQNLRPEETKIVNGITFQIKRIVEKNFIVKDIHFTDQGKDYHFQERVRALTLDDFKNYFTDCGLSIKYLFGDYQLNTFDPEKSDRLILIGMHKT
jgi:cyclopropane fatty-acyl-phospholipid synthase-like methyltransferase